LIAAAAMAVYGMSAGPSAVEKALRFPPSSIAGLGILLAIASGLASLAAGAPFLTGLWIVVPIGEGALPLSTPLLFDVGVFLTVFGTLTAILLALEEAGGKA
jgi:multicomponent Na+:H+ antiporter subunit B